MNYKDVVNSIDQINTSSQLAVGRSLNQILTLRNWLIGAYLVEYEQNGEDRITYGSHLIENLANDLKTIGVMGFSFSNLKNFRQFALAYVNIASNAKLNSFQLLFGTDNQTNQISQTSGQFILPVFPSLQERASSFQALDWQDAAYYENLFSRLTWSQLLELSRIEAPIKRAFYELECIKSRWSVRELKRQMNSMLYERVGLSKDKDAVMALAKEGQLIDSPKTILRDPYILEFIGLEKQGSYSESQLEQALIEHLQEFLHELGRDFCFMDRQYRITVAGQHYFLDLLFYHRKLRCLIAIDLKLGAFSHQDAGQMNFYLNYLKDQVAYSDENTPIGIILCAEKDGEEVHYATAGLDKQLFVSQYLIKLPSEEQLKQWLRDEQVILERLADKHKGATE